MPVSKSAVAASALAVLTASAGTAFLVPRQTIVQPKTVIVTKAEPGAALSRAEKRAAESSWGELAQPEIDRLSDLLKKQKPAAPVVIFCHDDARCGDLRDDLENALETAHWPNTKEVPFPGTESVGVTTTSDALRVAIDDATGGRLKVKTVPRNTASDYISIGAKK